MMRIWPVKMRSSKCDGHAEVTKLYGVFLQVGDHIEKIDGNTVVGCRHFEVAKMLKAIPKGHQFILRVVEPLKAGFGE